MQLFGPLTNFAASSVTMALNSWEMSDEEARMHLAMVSSSSQHPAEKDMNEKKEDHTPLLPSKRARCSGGPVSEALEVSQDKQETERQRKETRTRKRSRARKKIIPWHPLPEDITPSPR